MEYSIKPKRLGERRIIHYPQKRIIGLYVISMNFKIMTMIGAVGSWLAGLFGGWDTSLQTLLIFMAIDWFTGGFLLPAVFKKSPKSENGTLESRAGW